MTFSRLSGSSIYITQPRCPLLFYTTFLTFLFLLLPFPTSSNSNYDSLIFLRQNPINDPSIITLPSGLQFKIIRTGLGQYHPDHDSPTSIHYRGTTLTGHEFESSHKRKNNSSTNKKRKGPIFQPREFVKGMTEAMSLMVEGDKWMLYIPSELGHGDEGKPNKGIRGGDVLIYELEMIEIIGTKHDDKKEVRCIVKSGKRCNEKEKVYIEKMRGKYLMSVEEVKKWDEEINRLKKISVTGSDKVIDWCHRRIRILNQLKEESKSRFLDGSMSSRDEETEVRGEL